MTCPLRACQVAVLHNLWEWWTALAWVSRWLFANSRSLHPLSFVSNAKSSYCPSPVLVFIRAYYNTIKLLLELFDLLIFMV